MMKPTVKEITIAAGGLVVGGTVGYFIARKRATVRLEEHIATLDAVYEDAIDRVQKTGPYSTVDGAAAMLISVKEPISLDDAKDLIGTIASSRTDEPDEADDDEEEVTDDEAAEDELDYMAWNSRVIDEEETLLNESKEDDFHTPKHLEAPYSPTTDDEDPGAASNLKAFVERYETVRAPDDFAGVNFSGIVDDDDEEKAPSVPGFVTVRDPNGPYVISIDEYMEEDSPFTKIEMTYFDGDDTLVDSQGNIVPDIEKTVGHKNMSRFGQGTTDPSQVYIRNERLEIDIEVTKDDNTYTRAILGIIPDEEIARSMLKPLKMRDGDGD